MFLDEYSQLTSKCPISKLGEIFSYYYADINDVHILARDCIELDIRSAFPTICKIMFGEDNAFVKKIFSIEDKFERNKFIAIKLKAKQERENHHTKYIEDLNNYCKQFTFGKVYNNYNDVNILEYKKDSLLFNGETSDPIFQSVEDCLNDNNVEFRETKIDSYIRFEKTSIYVNSKNIIVKGKFKDCPEFIIDEVLPELLINNNLYNFNNLNKIKTKYSNKYFEILKQNNLINKIKYYYSFGDNQFLDSNGKFTKSIRDIDPNQILIKFLYPIISLLRSER
jgi:hypothetical protein